MPEINEFIYEPPDEQRYWVVRSDSGQYFPHFRLGKCAAIGHLDPFKRFHSESDPFDVDLDGLKEQLSSLVGDDKKSKSQVTNTISQIRNFVYEINIGDLIITLNEDNMMYGRVIGHPKYDNRPIEYVHDIKTGTSSTMSLGLRREVQWGPLVRRSLIPSSLARSFRANQTVFNIDEHWQGLHHLIYPAFYSNGRLFLSAKLGQKSDIENISVIRFLNFLTESEVFIRSNFDAELLTENSTDLFEEEIDRLSKEEELKLKTKAQFMSPGDIWTFLSGISGVEYYLAYYFIYSTIFGSSLLGWDGIIDKDTKKKLTDFILTRWEKRRGEQHKTNLGLTLPKYRTEPLEDSSKDAAPREQATLPPQQKS